MISNLNNCQSKSLEDFQYLSELLPYSSHDRKLVDFKQTLQDYLFLLYCLKHTVQILEAKSYTLFDPLVGENFCQSRALRVALTAQQTLRSLSTKKEHLFSTITKIETFISKGNKWFKENRVTFDEMLSNGLHIETDENELFFLLCYLLNQCKAVELTSETPMVIEKTDERKLRNIFPVSSRCTISVEFTKKMKNIARKLLAAASVKFIQDLAANSNDPEDIKYASKIHFLSQSQGQLQCIPFFRGTDIIFKEAMKSIPLVLWARQFTEDDRLIREMCLYYEPSPNGYIERMPTLKDLGKPVIVVQGFARRKVTNFPTKQFWRYDLKKQDALTYPLVCGASHRQFPDLFQDSSIESDPKLIAFKNIAMELGCSVEKPDCFTISHVYCSKLEDLAPLKYILNNHLSQYHEFYKELFINDIKKLYGNEALPDFKLEGSTLSFKLSKHFEFEAVVKKIHKGYFFMIDPKIQDFSDNVLQIELIINDKNNVYFDKINIAEMHSNPLQFLLDHKSYWSFQGNKIIKHLVSDPKSFENLEMMVHLLEVIKENEHNFEAQECALLGLGKALLIPELKEKAKEFLIEFITHVNSSHLRSSELKKCALQQLLHLVKNNIDVKEFIQKVSISDPLLSTKIEALCLLDDTIRDKETFNCIVVKSMILKAIESGLSNDSIRFLDYILWENQLYAYKIFQELGELDFTRQFIQILKIHKNDFALSFLKFIGIYTSDQIVFNEIVHALIEKANSCKAEAKRTQDYPYFFTNTTQPVSEVLADLMQNPAVKFPEDALPHVVSRFNKLNKDISIFACLPRGKEERRAEKFRIEALTSIILDEQHDKVQRILAIRSCAPYLVYEPEFGWTKEIHEQRKARNQKLAGKLIPILDQISINEAVDVDIRNEAKNLLSQI